MPSSGRTFVAGMTMYSANAPSRSTPMIRVLRQMWLFPVRHWRQCPHTICPSAVTSWPVLSSETASPTHDFAREFVTHHDRRLDPALRPGVPVGDVQVGPAHSGVAYRDEDLARPGRRLGDRRHRQAGGALLFDDRLHAKNGRGTRATQMMERVKPPSTWSTAPVI